MRPALLFPAITMLAALALATIPIAHAQGVVPLEWYQAGHVKPGYEVVVRLHAFGVSAGYVHAFADAGLVFQGYRYGIVGDDGWGPTVNVYYYLEGRKVKIDTFHIGHKEYDAYVKLTAYCPGEQPSGAPYAPPSSKYYWVHVDFNGQYERWDIVELGDDNVAPPLNLFYEKTKGAESWVHIDSSVKFKSCGNVIGEPPHEGSDTSKDPHYKDDDHFPWKWLALGVIVLLIILLIKI